MSVISIREASRRLGMDRSVVKGFAMGIGIHLLCAAKANLMTTEDFDRLKREIESGPNRVIRAGPPGVSTVIAAAG